MRSLLTLVAVTLWAALSHIAVAHERPSGIPDEAKYVKVDRVTDGDTIVLMDSTRVRLHGIDTPERDQPYGSEATAALESMVETSVYIIEVDTDRYERMVGQLYHSTEGYDINASMVCAGHAWWYERYSPDSKLLEGCQEEAQGAPKGLWDSEDPTPPWE